MSEIRTEDLGGLEFTPLDGPITPNAAASASDTPTDAPTGTPDEKPKRSMPWDRNGRKNEPAPPREPKPRKDIPPKPRQGELVKPLTEMYVSLGAVVMAFDPACGTAVMQNSQQCAESLETLARANPAVRRAIIALTQTSAWGGVLAAHLPILLIVLMHHGPKHVAENVKPYAAMVNGVSLEDLERQASETDNE